MSDNTPDPTNVEPPEGDNLAQLRQAADDGRKARADAEAARRELAFAKAGIDTDSGVGKLLFSSYTGEPSKEAVLAAAAEYGITPATPEAQHAAPVVSDEERRQSAERAALTTQSEPPAGTGPEPDPREVGLAEFRRARAEGKPTDIAADEFFGRVLEAAYAKGDERVIFDPVRHAQGAG